MSKKYIHVSPHVINSNKRVKQGETPYPCITVRYDRAGESFDLAFGIIIKDKDGNEVARIVYDPSNPIPPGHTCWIETDGDVQVVKEPFSH